MNKALRENSITFLAAMLVAWLVMYLVPSKIFFTIYVPFSFCWLFWLMILTVVGRGWPGTPPEGYWKPGMSKAGAGLLMTILSIVPAALTTLFLINIWPAFPLFPIGLYFGVLLFTVTLWYALNWCAYPIANKSGAVNVVVGAIVILAITVILWLTLFNFQGTPWADAAFNPNGLLDADFMLGLLIWIIVWIMIFGMSLQGYPFYKLGDPLGKIVLTVVDCILGYICWTVSLKFMSPSSSWAILGGSIIAMVLFQATAFAYFPNIKQIQPKRGIYNLIVVAAMVAIWIPLLRFIMTPVLAKANAAGVACDISNMIINLPLNLLCIILMLHSSFWFKMPYAPSGPPIGPEEIPPEGEVLKEEVVNPARV
ncbi:hypothetical protein ABDB91_15785 [Desulfoscipio sp. XC116]|uniref:hypothetical protein n=1 Tax=Desulfoscipio sp. XC116 TaxID=3144975 RepID=UPI00325B54B9